MKMVKFNELQAVSQILSVWSGVAHTGFGLAILIGGEARFAQSPLSDLVGGNVWIYGLIFMVSGFFMLAHHSWLVLYGALVGLLMMSAMSMLFLDVSVSDDETPLTLSWACAMFALADAVILTLVLLRRSDLTRRGG